MKKIFITIIYLLLIAGCSENGGITISGNFNGGDHDYIYLTLIDVNVQVPVDSAKIKPSGAFRFRFEKSEPNFYNLGFDDNEYITLLAYPDENIEISFTSDNLKNGYNIKGSSESEKIRQLDIRLNETRRKLDSIRNIYSNIEEELTSSTIEKELGDEFTRILDEQRKHNIAFILDNLTSFSAIKALYQQIDDETYVLFHPRDIQFLKLVSDSLNKYYPKSKQAKALAMNLDNELNSLYINQLSTLIQDVEPTNPDADLSDIDGNRVKLSSLRGKYYVLISFWSPESNECVSLNLQMKEYYKMYHNKGFEIYQVDVGDKEELWRSAVKFDELPWISVREDDPSNPLTAIIFNVSNVPSNYLIDLEGEIIGKNLFGRNLQIKLAQLFD